MLCRHDASSNELELTTICSTYGSFSYNFHLICLQAQQRVTPTSQIAPGWDPAAWSGASPYGGGLSSLLGSPSSSLGGTLNLSDYVVDTSTQHSTVRRSNVPAAAAGSAEQLQAQIHAAEQRQTQDEGGRDDVIREQDNEQL